jgi:hypothetical protein
MLKNETSFEDFKKDVRLLLDSFIRTNEAMAAVADFNDDLFEGMPALEEAKTLNRLIGGFSPDEETCKIIKTTLKLVSKQCRSHGSNVMAYAADTLLGRSESVPRNDE